jgi:hypothetical protein
MTGGSMADGSISISKPSHIERSKLETEENMCPAATADCRTRTCDD